MIELKPNYELVFKYFDFVDIIEWFPTENTFREKVSTERIKEVQKMINDHLKSRCSCMSEKSFDDLEIELLELIDYKEWQSGIDKQKFNDFLDYSLHDLAFLKNVMNYFHSYFIDRSCEINPYSQIEFDIEGYDEDKINARKNLEARIPLLKTYGLKEELRVSQEIINSTIQLKEFIDQVNIYEVSEIQLKIGETNLPIKEFTLISQILMDVKKFADRIHKIDQPPEIPVTRIKTKWRSKIEDALLKYLIENSSFKKPAKTDTSPDQRNIIGTFLVNINLMQRVEKEIEKKITTNSLENRVRDNFRKKR